MERDQWSQFKLRVNINAPVDEVYNCWATPGGLEKWFLRKALFRDKAGKEKPKDALIEEGDTYEWYWHGYPDSVVEKGTVLKANGKDLFSFTFSMKCPVTINMYGEAGELIVQLVESGLPLDDDTALKHFVGDSRGWIFYLANLKSVLEGGLDLRNKRMEITNVITA